MSIRVSPFIALCRLAVATAILAPALVAQAETVTLAPVADNTIFQGVQPSGQRENYEDNTCGTGAAVYAGRTDVGFLRRALLKFNLASIPAGATIDSATLTLRVTRVSDTQPRNMIIRRLTRDWAEGTVSCNNGKGTNATAGSPTWIYASFNSIPWTAAGGDFVASTSATATVGISTNSASNSAVWASNSGTFNNAGMVADLQYWLGNPAANYGWTLTGVETTNRTAREFASRNAGDATIRPVLVINYTPPASTFACCSVEGACTVATTASCTAGGGTPYTNQTTCSTNPCPQPTGACCNADESCSDSVTSAACTAGGGTFQGAASTCTTAQATCGLAPFVDALPIPAVLQPTGTRADGVKKYQVSVQEVTQKLHRDLPPTAGLWTYNGAFPSYTIEARVGTPIEVQYSNALPLGEHVLPVDRCAHGPDAWGAARRVSTHLHGGHVPPRYDGQPDYTILPGYSDTFEYPNNQLPATLWYHDHALGITRLNVYAGMAGFYLLRDSFEDGLGLPSGQYEVPLAIQDRQFNPDGSLYYPAETVNMFTGDKVLVNGKVWPFLNVARGKYRFRLLNGSQAREYTLRLENTASPGQVIPFTVIGTDNGLMSAPMSLGTIRMAPAERLDVIVDFTGFNAGTEIILRNDETTSPRVPNVMKFVVQAATGFTGATPATLRSVTAIPETEAVRTRWLRLEQVDDACAGNKWLVRTLDGPLGDPTGAEMWDDLSEFAQLGTTEIWEFENPSNMAHPMHMHLVSFQVVSRTAMDGTALPLQPWEIQTWKDTVRVGSNERVRVIARFEDYAGRYAYHCHILDHEDHEMMRQFQTVNAPGNCDGNGVCEVGEDSVSCATDCAEVTGARCGNGLCEVGNDESYLTCSADCNGQQTGQAGDFACGTTGTNPIGCGTSTSDTRCVDPAQVRACTTMPRLRASCGDRLCEGAETATTCALDCAVPLCAGTESPAEVSCGDGKDNDCDGLVDLADVECQPDTDADGIRDGADNCRLLPNPTQCDSDADGFGNRCDGDLNNNGATNAQDTTLFRQQLGQSSVPPGFNEADINCNGAVNAQDTTLYRQLLGSPPGPAGLAP